MKSPDPAAATTEPNPYNQALDQLRHAIHCCRPGQRPEGLKTWIQGLDAATGGLHPGTITLLAGGPPTALEKISLCIADAAMHQGKRPGAGVLVISLEERVTDFVLRLLARRLQINPMAIKHAMLDAATQAQLDQTLDALHAEAWTMDAPGSLPLPSLEGRIYQHLEAGPRPRLLLIEGLATHFAQGTTEDSPAAHAEKTIEQLQRLAQSHEVPILATLALPHFDLESEPGAPAPLACYGRLRHLPDGFWLLGREKSLLNEPKQEPTPWREVSLAIAHQPHGLSAWVRLRYDLTTHIVESVER